MPQSYRLATLRIVLVINQHKIEMICAPRTPVNGFRAIRRSLDHANTNCLVTLVRAAPQMLKVIR